MEVSLVASDSGLLLVSADSDESQFDGSVFSAEAGSEVHRQWKACQVGVRAWATVYPDPREGSRK